MFGFGKKKKKKQEEQHQEQKPPKKEKKTRMDKIVMGAILGVAIGSVVSMSLAPKKKENAPGEAKREKKGLFGGLFKKKQRKAEAEITEHPRRIPTEYE